jgi:hypothetical protein
MGRTCRRTCKAFDMSGPRDSMIPRAAVIFAACVFLALFSSAEAFSLPPIKHGNAIQHIQPGAPSSNPHLTKVKRPVRVVPSSTSQNSDGPVPVVGISTDKLKAVAQTAAGVALTFGLERSVATTLRVLGLRLPSAPIGKKKTQKQTRTFHFST